MVDANQILHGSNGKRWHLGGHLGSGSCCNVYSAFLKTDSETGCLKAAVKVFKEGEKYNAAAFREKELLYLVKKVKGPSPCIVELYDSFTWNGRSCLVEEFLEFDLTTQIRTKELTVQEIYKLSNDVARGLHTLHSCGFTHADLKPSNIMWSSITQTYKLIDFSLSFHLQDKHIPVIQSRPYRAPEVEEWNEYVTSLTSQGQIECPVNSTICEAKVPDPSCDIWSLGCIIKKLLQNSQTESSSKTTNSTNCK